MVVVVKAIIMRALTGLGQEPTTGSADVVCAHHAC